MMTIQPGEFWVADNPWHLSAALVHLANIAARTG